MHDDLRLLARISAFVGVFMSIAAVATSPAPPLTAGLTLTDAFKRMRTHDLSLALAQMAVEQAAADVLSAGERPNATLSYGTSKINPAGHNGPGTLWANRSTRSSASASRSSAAANASTAWPRPKALPTRRTPTAKRRDHGRTDHRAAQGWPQRR